MERLAEVLEALDTDEPGEALHYVRLFSDDDDLNQGLTAEIIRSQHLTERLEFLQVGLRPGGSGTACACRDSLHWQLEPPDRLACQVGAIQLVGQ